MHWSTPAIVAAIWCVTPLLAFAFATDAIVRASDKLPLVFRLLVPASFGVPYILAGAPWNRVHWLPVYLVLPVIVAVLLWHAKQSDPEQRGDWRDWAVLLVLGIAVDLRWLEPAWPAHLSVLSKLILLNSGLYGFLVIRQLTQVGFDLRIRRHDVFIGVRELLWIAILVIPIGLFLGFLHVRARVPEARPAVLTVLVTFFLIAIPEEIFFRGWIQNLLERRVGRTAGLCITAVIFGVSHFNKRATHFNWRYVLLATVAGLFYGRAWRSRNRVAASAITHTCVDTVWSLWL